MESRKDPDINTNEGLKGCAVQFYAGIGILLFILFLGFMLVLMFKGEDGARKDLFKEDGVLDTFQTYIWMLVVGSIIFIYLYFKNRNKK
jgi:hypothetical protein